MELVRVVTLFCLKTCHNCFLRSVFCFFFFSSLCICHKNINLTMFPYVPDENVLGDEEEKKKVHMY